MADLVPTLATAGLRLHAECPARMLTPVVTALRTVAMNPDLRRACPEKPPRATCHEHERIRPRFGRGALGGQSDTVGLTSASA